jgi:hypothetical protein
MKTESKADTPQTHAEFLASLREAHQNGRPISYFRQWPVEYLVEAGLPQDWLEKCGLVKTDGTATELPNQCSQRQFAEIVTKLFGKPVNQAAISRAVRFEGLNLAVTPSNGRLKTDAALQWWRTNKTTSTEEAATEAEHRRERQRIAREREEIELNIIKRKASQDWMLTEFHDFWGVGLATIIRQSMLSEHEKFLAAAKSAAKESGADDALVEKMMAALRPKMDAQFESWQVDLCGDEATGKLGRLDELDKAAWELSEQKKSQL